MRAVGADTGGDAAGSGAGLLGSGALAFLARFGFADTGFPAALALLAAFA